MNAETDFSAAQMHPVVETNSGLEGFGAFVEKLDSLRGSLAILEDLGDATTAKAARRLSGQIDDFEPSVTMIGQVKAGKTSLVNAMVRWPGLLPADVNPWTSVVTSLHVKTAPQEPETKAVFRFFEAEEWGRLLDSGGRIGELASRAGAEEEIEKIRSQIEKMRQKSQSRLGRKFELLLGQDHSYGYFDNDLIERYVCLGDDFLDAEEGVSETQGRFADITRSADLSFHRPGFPVQMCIRDTPGVNDTFMMREQITIRAIRDSRLCVVVLSAHQALSSMDLALIRLISNVKSREVIIFVNRVDELSDPSAQVPEIRASIAATLKAHDGPVDAQVVFGSAYWAEAAVSGGLTNMDSASAEALLNWAETELDDRPDVSAPEEMVWELSGVPALYRALTERIVEGVGAELITRVGRSAANLVNGVEATAQVVAQGDSQIGMSRDELMIEIGLIESRSRDALEQSMTGLVKTFNTRMDRSHKSFLDRALANLIAHLEKYGEQSTWEYSPAGLRLLLRSAYQVFGAKAQSAASQIYQSAADDYGALSLKLLGDSVEGYAVQAPEPDRLPPPVALGQTIALDLQGRWWKNWWQRRRGYRAFASGYYELIHAETQPIVEELKQTHTKIVAEGARKTLEDMLAEQRSILTAIVEQADLPADELAGILGVEHAETRRETLADIRETLTHAA